ncbi:MAG: carbon-nitrogen family hydrolase [Anaerolineales bacterium]|nr:carbon-nitrogen family hydrolase [Anaerolineales bacterium]
MRVASIQIPVINGDKSANLDLAAERIRMAKSADLVILPELWNIGFLSFDAYIQEAEEKDGPTFGMLRNLAKEVGAYLHTGSFVEKDGDQYFNSSYVLSPHGEILANYRKIHLFGYQSKESQILNPGKRLVVAETPIGKLGMATCYDLRFPEMFRYMVDMGSEFFLVCSAWPYPRLEHWLTLNKVRAFENQCFLISANSVGKCHESTFLGHSMIVNPWGEILASGGDEEAILFADLDLSDVQKTRERFPALEDRVAWLNPGIESLL